MSLVEHALPPDKAIVTVLATRYARSRKDRANYALQVKRNVRWTPSALGITSIIGAEMAAITEEMVKQTYEIAKKVYAGQTTIQDGVTYLNDKYKMNQNSAMMYINDFKCLLNGQEYKRIMAADDTKYFLIMIDKDFGREKLIKALNSLRLHIKYATSKGITSNVARVYDELVKSFGLTGKMKDLETEENIEITDDDTITTEDDNTAIQNFTYEKDLQNSLIFQAESLFPNYKIYGNNLDGIEYQIEGRRIDLLLENPTDNKLLIIELKAGTADFKTFGQISMYIGLITKKFPNKIINGIIIAGEIDESLKNACYTSDKIKLATYKMEITLNNVE